MPHVLPTQQQMDMLLCKDLDLYPEMVISVHARSCTESDK